MVILFRQELLFCRAHLGLPPNSFESASLFLLCGPAARRRFDDRPDFQFHPEPDSHPVRLGAGDDPRLPRGQ